MNKLIDAEELLFTVFRQLSQEFDIYIDSSKFVDFSRWHKSVQLDKHGMLYSLPISDMLYDKIVLKPKDTSLE